MDPPTIQLHHYIHLLSKIYRPKRNQKYSNSSMQCRIAAWCSTKELMKQLRSECKDVFEYEEKFADRSIIRRRPDINRLYGPFTREMYGSLLDQRPHILTLFKRVWYANTNDFFIHFFVQGR